MGKLSCEQKKKLSWSYRKKAKLKKATNSEGNKSTNVDNKNDRIIIKNLSFKVTEEDLRKFYEPFGQIKEINLPKRPDGKLVGCGFVQFKCMEDASKAIFNTNKKEFLGRIISTNWAILKSKFCQSLERNLAKNQEIDKDKSQSSEDIKEKNIENDSVYRKNKEKLKKQQRNKLQKIKKQKRRARIIIRNLSFHATEDNLREHFSQYGKIEEINILTKSDGKRVGCAFIQFDHVQSAAKAIHYANMQTILNRTIVVDWAVSKSKFSENNVDENDVKPEVKIEFIDLDEAQETTIKILQSNEDAISNLDAESDSKNIVKEVIEIKDSNEDDENVSEDSDDENDDKSLINRSIKEEQKSNEENELDSKSLRISNDVSEGKTIFVKNLPFSVQNNELKSYMEQFGPIYYAVICIDRLTEHSKGTAFVKFKDIAGAEKCLSSGTELHMHDQIIEVHRALHKNEIQNKKNLINTKIKDSRNLYLVKEGVVLAKSAAAMEVSVSDMEKRLKIEQWKSQMLRNLSMFVSRVRLVVHNLPPSLSDAELRQLFKNHSGSKAIIKEARIMRDLRNVDTNGKGKSKEYGFVTFTSHEDALKALRSINNNPNIFSKSRRPIVGFSIENRIIINAKERRIQKSRERNPLWSENKDKRKKENIKEEEEETSTKPTKMRKLDNSNVKSYVGITGKLGQNKLRSKFNLRSQAELHMRTVKKNKKLNKVTQESKIAKKERTKKQQDNKLIKRSQKSNTDDANFNKLVNSYRNKLQGINLKKSKWYETSNKS